MAATDNDELKDTNPITPPTTNITTEIPNNPTTTPSHLHTKKQHVKRTANADRENISDIYPHLPCCAG
jgi:hypothetical protein